MLVSHLSPTTSLNGSTKPARPCSHRSVPSIGIARIWARAVGHHFRVGDLDAMVAQLRAAEIEVDTEVYPNGRFAQLHDREANAIQP